MDANGGDTLVKMDVNGADTKKRVYKVVLTGGPCGGKTTGQMRLCAFFENLGWKVYRNPEEAYRFLNGGVVFKELSEYEANRFQENLLKTMLAAEQTFFELAESCNRNCLVICDRGTMDVLSYVSKETRQEIMDRNELNAVDLRDTRYHQIIHMVSAADGAPEFYSCEDHKTRHENIDNAIGQDRKTGEAWVGHPYIDVIDNSTDFETKIKRMIHVVCQKMGIDTGDRLENNSRKLKFLIKGPLPPDSEFPEFQDFSVEHLYLKSTSKKMQSRLRKRGKNNVYSYTHTQRKPEKLGQIVEVKTSINSKVWDLMQSEADENHHRILKNRRCFLHNNQYFQLDIYLKPGHPRCDGLIFLETYSTHSPAELSRRLPAFLNIVEDVTGKPEYSMFNLSLKDEWKDSGKFCHSIADMNAGGDDVEHQVNGLQSLDYTIHLLPQYSKSNNNSFKPCVTA